MIARSGQIAVVVAAVLLLLLHAVSPEFDPAWRMISEYAYGQYGFLLTLFFLLWGFAEWCAVASLWSQVNGIWMRTALVLLAVSGLGAVMGGLFDVRHPLHGAAFGIGVPFVPVAALMLSIHLFRRNPSQGRSLLWSAHATWITLIIMIIAMKLFIDGLIAAGSFDPDHPQMLQSLPAGVPAVNGIPNRLLVLSYLAWTFLANRTSGRILPQKNIRR